MIEKITVKQIMVAEFEVFGEMNIRFEKWLEGGTVRIFIDGNEVDIFTNYEIKQNNDKFEEACIEYIEEKFGAE